MEFSNKLSSWVAKVEAGLKAHLPDSNTRPARLHTAMRYSLEAGGKRLRPVLVLAAAELGGQAEDVAMPAAVAIECVHTYSLIHDDLPCMDNDDLRRGRPTSHRKFDEATALLAGDALLTYAFQLVATAYGRQPTLATRLVQELATAAGSQRLIGGQMEDLLAEKSAQVSAADLDYIHLNKTGAMIQAALVMGGLTGGLDTASLERLRKAGEHLGLAFQIVDDVLDATSDTATLGKTAGKDARAGKLTYVRLHGIDASRVAVNTHTGAAIELFRSFGPAGDFLVELAKSMVGRIS